MAEQGPSNHKRFPQGLPWVRDDALHDVANIDYLYRKTQNNVPSYSVENVSMELWDGFDYEQDISEEFVLRANGVPFEIQGGFDSPKEHSCG